MTWEKCMLKDGGKGEEYEMLVGFAVKTENIEAKQIYLSHHLRVHRGGFI
jgi:hypothetical protein